MTKVRCAAKLPNGRYCNGGAMYDNKYCGPHQDKMNKSLWKAHNEEQKMRAERNARRGIVR